MASPVFCDGHLYLLERRSGTLHCVNAETGATAYRQRIPGARSFWASPWTCQDRVFCLDGSGTTHVLAAGPDLKILGTNRLDEESWSSPAIADNALFCARSITCIASQPTGRSTRVLGCLTAARPGHLRRVRELKR